MRERCGQLGPMFPLDSRASRCGSAWARPPLAADVHRNTVWPARTRQMCSRSLKPAPLVDKRATPTPVSLVIPSVSVARMIGPPDRHTGRAVHRAAAARNGLRWGAR
jgi:hypothetical protein